MSAEMSALVTIAALVYGYTIDREYGGRANRRYVVRQFGEWVGSYETRDRAEHEIEIVRGGNLPK